MFLAVVPLQNQNGRSGPGTSANAFLASTNLITPLLMHCLGFTTINILWKGLIIVKFIGRIYKQKDKEKPK
jgi:hypothetical protein